MSDKIKALRAEPRFYVYHLIDPRSGKPFYIGKGQGSRAWAHERAVKAGKNSNKKKTAIILEILGASLSVEVLIVSRHSCEMEAYEEEVRQIAGVGRENLSNCNSGGHGSFSDRNCSSIASDLRVCADAFKLLLSMGAEAEWIEARSYSLQEGKLWYSRLTGLLKDLVNRIIDIRGKDVVRSYLLTHV